MTTNLLFRNTLRITPLRGILCKETGAKSMIPIDRGGGGRGTSLVAQAVHRVELRGARGRNRAEDDPD